MARHHIPNSALFGLAAITVSLLAAVFLKYIALPVFAAEPTASSEIATEHIVTIFDNGQKTSIKTSASSVAAALAQSDIRIEPSDTVEPTVDEQITSKYFFINIYRSRPVVVTDGATIRKVMTGKTDPREIAAEAGLPLHDRDQIAILPVTTQILLESGTNIHYEIHRAKVIHLNFYGRLFEVRSNAPTVQDFMHEQGIVPADGDQLSRAADYVLQATDTLELSHHGVHTISADEDIAYETQTIQDYNREVGYTQEQTPGQNGKKTVVYEVEMKNGKELSRKAVSELVTAQPVTRVVVVGAKTYLPAGSHEDWMRAAGISPSDFGYVEFVISKESGWGWDKYNRAGSGAYGLCQALPGNKMASAGEDWKTNPITQLKWCSSYAKSRYGGWAGAYNWWKSHNWW
jgi:uncharacterized protein YabE (DUF348 family)